MPVLFDSVGGGASGYRVKQGSDQSEGPRTEGYAGGALLPLGEGGGWGKPYPRSGVIVLLRYSRREQGRN